MGGGKWLADATSAQSIQVGGIVDNPYIVLVRYTTELVAGDPDGFVPAESSITILGMKLVDKNNSVYTIPPDLWPITTKLTFNDDTLGFSVGVSATYGGFCVMVIPSRKFETPGALVSAPPPATPIYYSIVRSYTLEDQEVRSSDYTVSSTTVTPIITPTRVTNTITVPPVTNLVAGSCAPSFTLVARRLTSTLPYYRSSSLYTRSGVLINTPDESNNYKLILNENNSTNQLSATFVAGSFTEEDHPISGYHTEEYVGEFNSISYGPYSSVFSNYDYVRSGVYIDGSFSGYTTAPIPKGLAVPPLCTLQDLTGGSVENNGSIAHCSYSNLSGLQKISEFEVPSTSLTSSQLSRFLAYYVDTDSKIYLNYSSSYSDLSNGVPNVTSIQVFEPDNLPIFNVASNDVPLQEYPSGVLEGNVVKFSDISDNTSWSILNTPLYKKVGLSIGVKEGSSSDFLYFPYVTIFSSPFTFHADSEKQLTLRSFDTSPNSETGKYEVLRDYFTTSFSYIFGEAPTGSSQSESVVLAYGLK